jgi:hypothetical protein
VTPGEPVARKTPLWVPDNSHGGGGQRRTILQWALGQHHGQEPIPEAQLVPWSPFHGSRPLSLTVAREICSQMAIWVHGQMFAWSEGHMTTQTHGHMVILSRDHMVVLQMVR